MNTPETTPPSTEPKTDEMASTIKAEKASYGNLFALAAFLIVFGAGVFFYVKHNGSQAKIVQVAGTGTIATATTTQVADSGSTAKASSVEGKTAPDFALSDILGETHQLASYKGTPTLIVFEATWCTFCKRENPDLEKFVQEYDGKVQVITVDINEDIPTVRAAWEARGNKRKVLVDAKGDVATTYGATGTPTHVFLDAEHVVKVYHPGLMTYDELISTAGQIL